MVIFAIFFILGLLIGVGSLRLVTLWEGKHPVRRASVPFKRHHS